MQKWSWSHQRSHRYWYFSREKVYSATVEVQNHSLWDDDNELKPKSSIILNLFTVRVFWSKNKVDRAIGSKDICGRWMMVHDRHQVVHTWLSFQGRNPSLETMYHVPIGMYQTLHTTGKDVHVLYILKMDAWTDDLVRTYVHTFRFPERLLVFDYPYTGSCGNLRKTHKKTVTAENCSSNVSFGFLRILSGFFPD